MKPVRLFRAKKNSNHIAGDSLFLPVVHFDSNCSSVELVHQLATQPGQSLIFTSSAGDVLFAQFESLIT